MPENLKPIATANALTAQCDIGTLGPAPYYRHEDVRSRSSAPIGNSRASTGPAARAPTPAVTHERVVTAASGADTSRNSRTIPRGRARDPSGQRVEEAFNDP